MNLGSGRIKLNLSNIKTWKYGGNRNLNKTSRGYPLDLFLQRTDYRTCYKRSSLHVFSITFELKTHEFVDLYRNKTRVLTELLYWSISIDSIFLKEVLYNPELDRGMLQVIKMTLKIKKKKRPLNTNLDLEIYIINP